MSATEVQQDGSTSGEAVVRVIDECVLAPIPGPMPAGEKNIRELKLWVDLRVARPKIDDGLPDHDWQRANPVDTDWDTYRELVQKALCNQAKDLELGLFLAEASTRVYGFAGVRDGLWMVHGLIREFADKGLYPEAEDGDLEAQYGKLNWLNERFTDVIREIPLTQAPDAETNYSLNYRDESRRQGGMITSEQYEALASAGATEAYKELLGVIQDARSELDSFRSVVVERYGNDAVPLNLLQETLDECVTAVRSILHKRQVPGLDGAGAVSDLVRSGGSGVGGFADSAVPTTDAWSACERLARSGNIDAALSTMASLAASEPNGRIRFQRKLLLADLCIKTNRKYLGVSILQELNEIIEQHKLELWETSELVGGVWARLVRCYRDKAAGTANWELEDSFYRKLSRLDPWQALACGEMTKRE